MSRGSMTCEQAKKIDIVDYLLSLGYQPQKIKINDYWYISPFREEKTPSFKVNRKLNSWYDHGLGKGGNLIDFGILFHHCPVREFLERLSNFSFHPHTHTPKIPQYADEKGHIKIITVSPISSKELCNYLSERKIPFEIANRFCKEIHFELYGKKYTAIGFENNAGGYELRSKDFKGSSSPKDATLINNGSQNISVFEGFFSFLSWQAVNQSNQQLPNFLVLNSLSFFEKMRPVMEKHFPIDLFLDRDKAGIKATRGAIIANTRYKDQSSLYRGYKDLNDKLTNKPHVINQSRCLRRRF